MILEELSRHATTILDRPAIVDERGEWTYGQLHQAAGNLAGYLNQTAAADRVGLLLPPSGAFAVGFLATLWSRRVAMPLNYLLRPQELLDIIADSGLRLILTQRSLAPQAEPLRAAGVELLFIEDLTAKYPHPPLPQTQPDDLAVLLYTSGTSGRPKGVMLTGGNLKSNALDSVAHARFNTQSVFLGILPMFHTLGLTATFLIPMMLGAKVVYPGRFSPVATSQAIAAHQIEVIIAVPSLYAILAGAKSVRREHFASIKLAISGGEPLAPALIEEFQNRFGLTLMEGYGLTETSPIVSLSVPWAWKPGSTGQIIPHVQIRFVDDDGKEVPHGQEGELLIQGPNVMKGYYQQPETTASVLCPQGWFRTGDLARVDPEGFLFITGRKKEMIIMAGEKVFPREIEDTLKAHPAILSAAVVGAKDPQRGEMPVAFVEVRSGMTPPTSAELRSFVRERIAAYKTPREVHILEALPRNSTGKILKRVLLEGLQAG